jgi:hypothetical protein
VAGTCRAAGPGAAVLPHLGTSNGREVVLVVTNPSAGLAEVSISLHAGTRILKPKNLIKQLIEPRRSRVFRLEDFAFSVDELAVVVTSEGGRFVAEALQTAPGGVTLVEGDPIRSELVAVSGASGRPAGVGLVAAGADDTGLEGALLGLTSQGRTARVPPDLRPGATADAFTPSVGEGGPAAYRVTVTVGGGIGAGTSWPIQRRGRDDAAVGSAVPALGWVAAIGTPLPRASVRAVIVNPSTEIATVAIRRLGGGGRADLIIEPGRLARVPVGSGKGAFGLAVDASVPVVVLLEGRGIETVRRLSTTYGFGLYAQPLDEHEPVPVGIDPRAGVPAPLLARDQ